MFFELSFHDSWTLYRSSYDFPLVRKSVFLCFVQRPPYTIIYKECTCFEVLHVCSFGSWSCAAYELNCFSFILSVSVSIHMGSLKFHMYYSACIGSFGCGACMHHCICMCWNYACTCMHVSLAWRGSACVCTYQELSRCTHRFAACKIDSEQFDTTENLVTIQ